MCHEIADVCVQAATSRLDFSFNPSLMLSPHDFVGTKHTIDGHDEQLTFTEEMARWIEPGLAWIAERRIVFFEAEQWLDLTSYLGLDPETGRPQGGYLDMGWIETNSTGEHTCVIWDWKFGQEPVSVTRNLQLILYAVGFYQKHKAQMERFGVTRFRLVIEQPRVEGGGDAFDISLREILEIADWLAIRAAMVTTDANHRVAGLKQCRWCEAKNHGCDAYDGLMLQTLAGKLPDVMEPGQPAPLFFEMTPAARGYLLKHKTEIVAWLERLHANAIDDALRGLPTPGNKLAAGRRSPREWIDPVRAIGFLYGLWRSGKIDDTHTHKLLSPAQTAEAIGEKRFKAIAADLVRQGTGKPVLVDDDDPKPALALLVDRMPDVSE
jgi:hypothetical protein